MTWIPWGAKPDRKLWIGERTAQRGEIKIAIENIDSSTIEGRRQKKCAVERRKAFINRAARGVIESHGCCVARAGPTGDEAIFSVKNELPSIEISTVPVRHVTRWTAGPAIAVRIARCPGYCHHEPGILVALVVIESGSAAVIIGDPEVLPWKNGDPHGFNS